MQLDQLKILLEVVEQGSFAKVAERRNINPSSVSRVIQSLEDSLGFTLFQRTTRSLQLTEAGEVYCETIQKPLQELELAKEKALDTKDGLYGKLRVTLPLDYGEYQVLPLIPKFQQLYPNLQLEWILTDDCLDLEKEKIDVGIRLGEVDQPNWVAQLIGPLSMTLCASPEFLHQYQVTSPEDVSDMPVLTFLPNRLNTFFFYQPESDLKAPDEAVYLQNTTYVSTATSAKKLCEMNMGAALLPAWMVEEAVDSGRLVRLLDDLVVRVAQSDGAAWCIYPSRHYVPKKARVLIDYLLENLRENNSG